MLHLYLRVFVYSKLTFNSKPEEPWAAAVIRLKTDHSTDCSAATLSLPLQRKHGKLELSGFLVRNESKHIFNSTQQSDQDNQIAVGRGLGRARFANSISNVITQFPTLL